MAATKSSDLSVGNKQYAIWIHQTVVNIYLVTPGKPYASLHEVDQNTAEFRNVVRAAGKNFSQAKGWKALWK